MGGVEDDEPASKRLKLAGREEAKGHSNGVLLSEAIVGSSIDLMARPLQSEEDEEVIGSKGFIRKVEFVQIIMKALCSLGYKKSCALLEEESGIPLHSSTVNLLMQQVFDGNWGDSILTLNSIGLKDDDIFKSASFLILEQKFYELLDGENIAEAIKTLRSEIAPLCPSSNQVRELSLSLVSLPQSVSAGSSNQVNLRAKSRTKLLQELQELFSPTVMVPERRLEQLVEQALILQRDACIFHNSFDREMSLYTDHRCGKDQIPSRTLQILEAHSDEVWFLKFSHTGKYLASSSNDRSAIIWEVGASGKLSIMHRLSGHQRSVSSVSWSCDDRKILTCGVEEAVRCWDVSTGECLHVYEKPGLGLVSCGWSPDGKSILAGVNDKSICIWELDGKEIECWKGQRTLKISDLEITGDGKQIISICRENVIILLDKEAKTERMIQEDQTITSFSLSRDNRYLLVNLSDQAIHLWNIHGDIKLVAKYRGHKRTRFIIRSCFGGSDQAFIASGSEDSQVYIWHRGSGELIEALSGHSGSVNCVSWNPANPHMLASASDDGTIRIWGLNSHLQHKHQHQQQVHRNGIVANCNGKA
ncbi:WD repeat-containing protein 26 homolog [Linum grandiflorum]